MGCGVHVFSTFPPILLLIYFRIQKSCEGVNQAKDILDQKSDFLKV